MCVGGDRVRITYTYSFFQIYKCLDILKLYWSFFDRLFEKHLICGLCGIKWYQAHSFAVLLPTVKKFVFETIFHMW